jgi:ribosomal protein S18 acetylase RimI-like enzyme
MTSPALVNTVFATPTYGRLGENGGMTLVIDTVDHMDDELARGLLRLLPQLSRTASRPEPAALAIFIEHPANTVLVARIDGEIVGTLTLVIFPLLTGVRAWIEDVVVDEAVRGQGVGAALTREAVRIAEKAGARTVDLTSRPDRAAANRLYLNLGFELRNSQVFRYNPAKG